jgi:hypothetical protein
VTITCEQRGRFQNRLRPFRVLIACGQVIFVDELDDSNPHGVKGVGEAGIVGVPAAIANAVYHATGKRVRDLPITLDKAPSVARGVFAFEPIGERMQSWTYLGF